MFSNKFLIVCCFALAAVVQAKHDYLFGTIAPTDVLIGRKTISHKVLYPYSYDYVFTQKTDTPLTITAIRITDNSYWKGATAAIKAGGIGETEVTLSFTGKPGTIFKSTVEIYAALPPSPPVP